MTTVHYTDYMLDKWSRMVRIRDNHTCRMCAEKATSKRLMQSHHIHRKHDVPTKALHLDNGITLCADCHLRIVHSTETNHVQYRVMFRAYLRKKSIRLFNVQYQFKLNVVSG